MEKYLYTCNYCGKEYIPTRRGQQLYCSTSCRVRAYQVREKLKEKQISKMSTVTSKTETTSQKPNKINVPDIANAALGVGAVELVKNIFSYNKEELATKKETEVIKNEIKELANKIDRYHRINDIPFRNDGAIPHLDINTNKIVYIMPPKKPLNFI